MSASIQEKRPSKMSGKRRFRGNTSACLIFLPFWSIAFSLSFFYLSLYFRACGMTDAQLGFLVTAGAGASILFSFLAAPIVDRMGRKRATLIFDITGSALPLVLFAANGSFVFALVGTLIANSGKIMNVGYYLLMTEDSDNDERAAAFNIFNIFIIASGLLVPIVGGFVAQAGVIAAERIFLLASAAVMTVAAFGRNSLVTETSLGRRIKEKRRAGLTGERKGRFDGEKLVPRPRLPLLDWANLIDPYRAAISFLFSNRQAAAAIGANVLFYVFYIVGTNNSLYFAPFFADALGMKAPMVGVVGAIFSGGTLFSMLFLNPSLFRKMGPALCAALGAALNLLGFIPLIFLRKGGVFLALGAVGVAAIGYGMLKSAIDAVLATCFGGQTAGIEISKGEEARSGVYSVANLLSSALGMGVGALCSLFYASAPRFIPTLSVVILAAICTLLYGAARSRLKSEASRRTS